VVEQRDAANGRFARWRERRRDKRQEAREREFYELDRSKREGGAQTTEINQANDSTRASAYGTATSGFWVGPGGDGGGV
jgi:hypothetical protein